MLPFKAMILAAGLGTRLRPLTYIKPKVLAALQNRPLLDWLIDYLAGAGAETVILNAWHLSDVLVAYVASHEFEIPVEVRVEGSLLGTGGGIANVRDFWDDRPFVVVNSDILTSVDIQRVLHHHQETRALATLVLTDDSRFNQIRVSAGGEISGFKGSEPGCLAFTGIQVLEPRVLKTIPTGAPVSIIDCYEHLIAGGGRVMAHVVQGRFWRELGTIERYLQVHRELYALGSPPLPGLRVGGEPVVDPSARGTTGVKLQGMVCIGPGCELAEGVSISESILWNEVQVKAGCSIRNSIIGDRVVVRDSMRDAVVVR